MKTVCFPKLKVKNTFLAAECQDVSVKKRMFHPDVYRNTIDKLVMEALGTIDPDLEEFFRGSLWDPSHHTTKAMMDYTSSVIKSAVDIGMQQTLLSSPWGLSRLTEIFCHQPTKERMVEYLQRLAAQTGLLESDYVMRADDGRVHLLLHRLNRQQLEGLKAWYEDTFGSHWIKRLHVLYLPDRPAPFLQRGYHMNFVLELEGAKGPETFAFVSFMLKLTFTQPFVEGQKWQKSLTDIGADSVALMLLRTFEETNEDQLENITVEKLEVPVCLLPKVEQSYKLIKSKTERVYNYHKSHNLGAMTLDAGPPDEDGFNTFDINLQLPGEEWAYLIQLKY